MASEKTIIRGLYLLGNVTHFEIIDPTEDGMPGTVETFMAGLGDLTDEQVSTAFAHFVRTLTSKSAYTKILPGDIRALVSQIDNGDWSEGWAEYLSRANAYGGKGTCNDIPWSSWIVKEAAQRCGGTFALRECPTAGQHFFQAQFKKHFEAIVAREAIQDTLQATSQDHRDHRGIAPLSAISPAGRPIELVRIIDEVTPHPDIIQIEAARESRGLLAPEWKPFTHEDAQATIERLKILKKAQGC